MASTRRRRVEKKAGHGINPEVKPATPSDQYSDSDSEELSWSKRLLGFDHHDFRSFHNFVQLCSRPVDPSGLAAFRIAFGIFMIMDNVHERGLSFIVQKWSDEFEVCRFPLINNLQPPAIEYMVLVYLIMAAGAVGIAVGLSFRLSCLMFVIPYWFIFALEKSAWNNHSYLFGLTGTMFLFTDANRIWSVDSWRKGSSSHIPIWQYGLFRFQIFIVYFIAGLKKLDRDWVDGYSMTNLGYTWVFDPFRKFLTTEQIDLYIVHGGGLIIDLTAGFLLYLDNTRWIGTAMVTSFHFMNSRIFRIGQFPYVMLVTTAIFYPFDWPKKLLGGRWTGPVQKSQHCLYHDKKVDIPGIYHKLASVFVAFWILWQSFMPYSHFITRGYNTWSGGLYGYSWDMMVLNTDTQHVKVMYVSKATGEEGYLDPNAFVRDMRWSNHPDMIKQHALCIANYLEEDYSIPQVEIYMDIWQSMNKRFSQRIIDPSVNLVTAPWNPFYPTPWMLPLLNDLEDWRLKLKTIAAESKQRDADWFLESADVTFVADFPGMSLENYIDTDLSKTNITLLTGSADLIQADETRRITLQPNVPVRLKSGTHHVFVTSTDPAAYMYTYSNTTRAALNREINKINADLLTTDVTQETLEAEAQHNETLRRVLDLKNERDNMKMEHQENTNMSFWQHQADKIEATVSIIRNSFWMSYSAVESLLTGRSMVELIEQRFGHDITEFPELV